MANRSTFVSPNYAIDTFVELLDLPIAQAVNAARYIVLRQKVRTTAEETEYNGLITTLQSYIITPETMNKLQDCITSMETFISTGVAGYITTKQAEFEAEIDKFIDCGTYNASTQYYDKNFVHYNGDLYICILDSLNNLPTDATYFTKLTVKGDTGYGVGLSPKGAYSGIVQYQADDLVTYSGNLYRCILASLNNVPTNATYWELFLTGDGENLANLNTTDKTSLVGAINETLANEGSLASLNTTDKTSLVDAINELLTDEGDLSTLTTTEKSDLVGAINEIDGNVDNLAGTGRTTETVKANADNIATALSKDLARGVTIDAPAMTGGTVSADALCWSGQKISYTQPGTGMAEATVAYVDVLTLRYYLYSAGFRIKSNNVTSSSIVELNVKSWNGSTWDVVATTTLLGTDFVNTTAYHVFNLGFDHVGATLNKLRFEVNSQAIANLVIDVDSIVVSQIQAAGYMW